MKLFGPVMGLKYSWPVTESGLRHVGLWGIGVSLAIFGGRLAGRSGLLAVGSDYKYRRSPNPFDLGQLHHCLIQVCNIAVSVTFIASKVKDLLVGTDLPDQQLLAISKACAF